jgi:hypothetical protein
VDSSVAYSAVQATLAYDAAKVTFTGYTKVGDTMVTDSTTPGTLNLSAQGLSGAAGSATVWPSLQFAVKDLALTADETAAFTVGAVKYAVTGVVADQDGAGAPSSITIKFIPVDAGKFEVVAGSKLAPSGSKVIAFLAPDSTGGYTYGGADMFYAPAIGAASERWFIYIVPDSVTTYETPVSVPVAKTAGGDVNGNSAVNIVDAQIALDLANGATSADFDALTAAQRLNADVNGDGMLTAADARAIQYFVHYGTFVVAP